MQWSTVTRAVGLVLLIALAVITFIYNQQEEKNLMYLFGLFLLLGISGAFYFFKVILPALGDSITTAMTESGEHAEKSPMVRIRTLIAQGDYGTAAEEIKIVTAENPGEKIPWMERAKLHEEKLGDPIGAICTFEEALRAFDWEEDDRAYFLFRLVDLHEGQDDKKSTDAILNRIIEAFPDSRYAANAKHKKRELGIAPEKDADDAEAPSTAKSSAPAGPPTPSPKSTSPPKPSPPPPTSPT